MFSAIAALTWLIQEKKLQCEKLDLLAMEIFFGVKRRLSQRQTID
jgi:hypothetical protein